MPKAKNDPLDTLEPLPIWTGQNKKFVKALRQRLQKAKRVDIIISFIMESGVKALIDELKNVPELRILTGSYLNITQPWALRTLKEECPPNTRMRFFKDTHTSFHPKSWIFYYEDGIEVIVGSSNLSWSALTFGVEWNCALTGEEAEGFARQFDKLFEQEAVEITEEVLEAYSKNWKKPPITHFSSADPFLLPGFKSKPECSPKELDRQKEDFEKNIPQPRNVQIEALYALKHARANDIKKGLVQAATGVGKTFLAAFDSRNFKRILFVAHREEILNQAQRSFKLVRPELSQGRIDGSHKETQADSIFASIQTLARMVKDSLFAADAFDYIVIDEFHHAVTDSYKTVTKFFRPEFLLGLTATPDRLDGRDVYALCDYNVPYAITLQEAINKGILCPFRYYGIFYDTDYSQISIHNGRYNISELSSLYQKAGARTELILGHFHKHNPKKTLAFCASKSHATQMADAFNQAGIPAAAVFSGSEESRQNALQSLTDGKIKVLFSVDMFNEGVDLPEIDLVMMLRPTESPTIFLQQLGRGLRKAENKPYLTVPDFIGNYRNANRIPELLSDKKILSYTGSFQEALPLDCQLDFDLRLIDLFETMRKNGLNIQGQFEEEFRRIEALNSKRPSRTELFTQMDGELLDRLRKGKNPLHNYFVWLKERNKLLPEEQPLVQPLCFQLITILETTSMSKLYKIPVLYTFIQNGQLVQRVSIDQILETWKCFFAQNENWKDLPGIHSYEEYLAISDKVHRSNILRNPVHFLEKSSKGIFRMDADGYFAINPDLHQFLDSPALKAQWQDILEFRTLEYRRNRWIEH